MASSDRLQHLIEEARREKLIRQEARQAEEEARKHVEIAEREYQERQRGKEMVDSLQLWWASLDFEVRQALPISWPIDPPRIPGSNLPGESPPDFSAQLATITVDSDPYEIIYRYWTESDWSGDADSGSGYWSHTSKSELSIARVAILAEGYFSGMLLPSDQNKLLIAVDELRHRKVDWEKAAEYKRQRDREQEALRQAHEQEPWYKKLWRAIS